MFLVYRCGLLIVLWCFWFIGVGCWLYCDVSSVLYLLKIKAMLYIYTFQINLVASYQSDRELIDGNIIILLVLL